MSAGVLAIERGQLFGIDLCHNGFEGRFDFYDQRIVFRATLLHHFVVVEFHCLVIVLVGAEQGLEFVLEEGAVEYLPLYFRQQGRKPVFRLLVVFAILFVVCDIVVGNLVDLDVSGAGFFHAHLLIFKLERQHVRIRLQNGIGGCVASFFNGGF